MANDEKIKELAARLEAGVKSTFESDHYKKFLSFLSQFHSYSLRNAVLIQSQCPAASLVKGFAAWKEMGRYVKKGEKGIAILAPSAVNRKEQETVSDENGLPQKDENGNEKTREVTKTILRFFPVYVYDVSQTDGEPLPQICEELTGKVSDFLNVFQAVKAMAPYPVEFEQIETGAKGYCDYKNRRIVLKLGMSEEQTLKTLIHELAHSILHENGNKPQKEKEVEAESVAFIVSDFFGVDTSGYSFEYVAHWSGGKELAELQAVLTNIQKCANDILCTVQKNLLEITQEAERPNNVSLQARLQQAEQNSRQQNEIFQERRAQELAKQFVS